MELKKYNLIIDLNNDYINQFLINCFTKNILSYKEHHILIVYIFLKIIQQTTIIQKQDLYLYFVCCTIIVSKLLYDEPYDNMAFSYMSDIDIEIINKLELYIILNHTFYSEVYQREYIKLYNMVVCDNIKLVEYNNISDITSNNITSNNITINNITDNITDNISDNISDNIRNNNIRNNNIPNNNIPNNYNIDLTYIPDKYTTHIANITKTPLCNII